MKSFDERAKDWDADPAKVARAVVVADAIRTAVLLKPGMRALEYGCGTGLLSFALQQDFASITLADTSQGMLDVLAEKIQHAGVTNMHPLLVNTNFQPMPETQFDIIYSLLTLHHIPDTEGALRHFRALLSKGGFVGIADLDKEDGSFHGPEVRDVHLGFERENLKKRMESAGFGEVRFTTAFSVIKQVDGNSKAFPVFLLTAQAV